MLSPAIGTADKVLYHLSCIILQEAVLHILTGRGKSLAVAKMFSNACRYFLRSSVTADLCE